MPNPPLPLPATTIQAAWGQNVTTRVVNVYQNAGSRDAALPTPEDGQLAWLLDEDVLTVRIAGVIWVTAGVGTFVQIDGDTMEGNLGMGDHRTFYGSAYIEGNTAAGTVILVAGGQQRLGAVPTSTYMRDENGDTGLELGNGVTKIPFPTLIQGELTMDANLNLAGHVLHSLPATSMTTAPGGNSIGISAVSSDPSVGHSVVFSIMGNAARQGQIAIGKNGGMWFRGIDGDGPAWGAWQSVATN